MHGAHAGDIGRAGPVADGGLRTRGDAAALPGVPAATVESLVRVRSARQEVLHADPPLRLDAVLDEAVLRRQVGGPG